MEHPANISDLISFWDFQGSWSQCLTAVGPGDYTLEPMDGKLSRLDSGVFGPYGLELAGDIWYRIERQKCPLLNRRRTDSDITVVAWIKRYKQKKSCCEAIAGMWDETRKKRQYCLFLNLQLENCEDKVCGHVSGIGGPTVGYISCRDAAVGKTAVLHDRWQSVGFSYDKNYARVYLDGKLDCFEGLNPYYYPGSLFDGGDDGSNFTLGAVNRAGEIGNFFRGVLGGIAIYARALTDEEISQLTI